MNNLKSVTNLPFAESAEGLNLIVNDNGAAKQIAASAVGAQADWNEVDENSPSFIQNKPTKLGGYNRELVYEKYFAPEDGSVDEIWEKFADASIFFEDGVEMCVEFELYAYNESQDYAPIGDRFVMGKLVQCYKFINIRADLGQVCDFDCLDLDSLFSNSFGFTNDEGEMCAISNYAEAFIYNRVQYDNMTDSFVPCDEGGMFVLFADCPIKSVKLYKITY